MNIKVLPGGTLPTYAKEGDAGLDVYARTSGFIIAGSRHTIPLGFSIAIPPGHVGLISGRSGLASKQGIAILGGVVDASYRGEVHAILHNTGKYHSFYYDNLDRIAQMLIVPYVRAELQVVDELEETARGTAGMGSTGVR